MFIQIYINNRLNEEICSFGPSKELLSVVFLFHIESSQFPSSSMERKVNNPHRPAPRLTLLLFAFFLSLRKMFEVNARIVRKIEVDAVEACKSETLRDSRCEGFFSLVSRQLSHERTDWVFMTLKACCCLCSLAPQVQWKSHLLWNAIMISFIDSGVSRNRNLLMIYVVWVCTV